LVTECGSGQLQLCPFPVSHWAALEHSLLLPFDAGVGVVLMERWSPEAALGLIAQRRITHAQVWLSGLMHLPEPVRRMHDVSSLRYVLHGSSPTPIAVKRAAIDWLGPIVWECYASTEGEGTCIGSAEWLRKPGSVGKGRSDGDVLILDERSEPCPPGEIGDVFIKASDAARFEYHGRPSDTEYAWRGEYFTVEDRGYLDRNGWLYLEESRPFAVARCDISLALVSRIEVENMLSLHPAVCDVTVVGVPGADGGLESKQSSSSHPPSAGPHCSGRTSSSRRILTGRGQLRRLRSSASSWSTVRRGSRHSSGRAASTSSISSRARQPEGF
jgi:long-chain acyl-CoA synthetase